MSDSDSDDFELERLKTAEKISNISGAGASIIRLNDHDISVGKVVESFLDALLMDVFPDKKIMGIFGLLEYNIGDPPVLDRAAPMGVVVLGAWQTAKKCDFFTAVDLHTALRDGTIPENFQKWINQDPDPYSRMGRSGYCMILRNQGIFNKIQWTIPKLLNPKGPNLPKASQYINVNCSNCGTSSGRDLRKCISCPDGFYCSTICQRYHWESHLKSSLLTWPGCPSKPQTIFSVWEKIFDAAYEADELTPPYWGIFGFNNISDNSFLTVEGKLLREIVLKAWGGIINRMSYPSIVNPEDIQQALFDGNLPEKFHEWISVDSGYVFGSKYQPNEEQLILRNAKVFNQIKWTVPRLIGIDVGQCGMCGTNGSASVKTGRVLKVCGKCKVEKYCSRTCQVQHWKVHKDICKGQTKPAN